MKRLFSIVAMVFVTMAASAQITWSVKAGLGLSACTGDVDMDNSLVGRIGVGIEKPLTANWSLMPSLELAIKGGKMEEIYEDTYTYGISYGGWREEISIYYLQLPVLAAYRLNLNDSWNMTIKAGPYFAYALFGNGEYEEKYYGEWEGSDNFDIFGSDGYGLNRFDFGLDLGVDFEHHRYVFGLEYEFGLTNMFKGSDEGKLKNAAGYITVGYKF